MAASELPTQDLQQATERMNATLLKAERWLAGKNFGVSAAAMIAPPDGEAKRLWFGKDGREWRLMLEDGPLLNASREWRLLALGAIPELFIALEAEAFLQQHNIDQAIESVERYMEGHP